MTTKLNYLLKVSMFFSIIFLVSCANYGQGERIDLNKNVQNEKSEMKEKKEMKESSSKTDAEISEALQAYVNAIKMQQVKAVMEFDINTDLKDWGVTKDNDDEINAWGGVIDATKLEGIGEHEAGDIRGWGDKGVKSIGGIEGGGQSEGIGEHEAGDIKGWGSMPRSDVESIFKAEAIKDILNASKSDIFGFANAKQAVAEEDKEVKGYAKNQTKKENKKSYFGFDLSSPTDAQLKIAAKTAKAQLAQISALLEANRSGDISGFTNSKCVKTKCLLEDLNKIMSDGKN